MLLTTIIPHGGGSDIETFAGVVKEYGPLNYFLAITAVAFIISLPSIISWIKAMTKRKEDEKLYVVLTELTEQIKVLVLQYTRSISYDMTQVIIESFLRNASNDINHFAKIIIEQNNLIANRDTIEARLHAEVANQLERLKTRLSLFEYKGHPLKSLVKEQWKSSLAGLLIKIIYNPNMEGSKKVKDLEEFVNRNFDNFSYELLQELKTYQTH
jgi:hypothetical protein